MQMNYLLKSLYLNLVFSALLDESECLCGFAYNTSEHLNVTMCDRTCHYPDATMRCGGTSSFAVYHSGNTHSFIAGEWYITLVKHIVL